MLATIEVVRTYTGFITKDEYFFYGKTMNEILDKVDARIKKGGGLFNKLPFKCINVLLYNTVLANRYDKGAWKV